MKNIKVRLISIIVVALLLAAGCVPAGGQPAVHTVEPGDTLAKIAQAHDTTVEELVELNKDSYPSLETNPGAIEVGWELQVPGGKGGGIKDIITINTPSANAGGPAAESAMDRDAFEMEIVRLVNEERVKAGLAPLEVDPGLMQFARERSEDMVARGYYSHYDPVTGADLSGDAGENILKSRANFLSPTTAKGSVATWMRSEGHKKNILRQGCSQTGVGVFVGENYMMVTQLFK